MKLLPYLYLLCQSGALFTVPPSERVYDNVITPLTVTSETSLSVTTPATIITAKDHSTSGLTRSALITMAPLSRNPLELRQKCFDDRGFSVDCATWTGYYYTWGPAGDPYAGGPGDDGSGSSGSNVVYVGGASHTMLPLAICYIILMNIITLWAALSLA